MTERQRQLVFSGFTKDDGDRREPSKAAELKALCELVLTLVATVHPATGEAPTNIKDGMDQQEALLTDWLKKSEAAGLLTKPKRRESANARVVAAAAAAAAVRTAKPEEK